MVLQAIKYRRGNLQILDQLKLPYQETFVDITSSQDAWNAIRKMQVRGAPAIAIVAALSVAVWLDTRLSEIDEVDEGSLGQPSDMIKTLQHMLNFLMTSRPTAVNLGDAVRKLERVILASLQKPAACTRDIAEAYIGAAEQMLADDVYDNERIGHHGATWLLGGVSLGQPEKVSILTHCNTGYVRLLLFYHCLRELEATP